MSVVSPFSRNLLRLELLALALLVASTAWGGSTTPHTVQPSADLPVHLVSSEQHGVLSADIHTTLATPFADVASALDTPADWCQFMPLHFNITACTYQKERGVELLTLYSGRKSYQTPEESYAITYHFDVTQHDSERFNLQLRADRGPAGTRDYRIEVEAQKTAQGTLLQIHSSYRPSFTSTLLTNGYLATLGRDKVGFSSVIENGHAHLVTGVRGVIERNVMRYELAINAFLETRTLPPATRHEAALEKWFKANDSYPLQLHEMSEAEYLSIKHREWANQLRLQHAIDEKSHLAAMH